MVRELWQLVDLREQLHTPRHLQVQPLPTAPRDVRRRNRLDDRLCSGDRTTPGPLRPTLQQFRKLELNYEQRYALSPLPPARLLRDRFRPGRRTNRGVDPRRLRRLRRASDAARCQFRHRQSGRFPFPP